MKKISIIMPVYNAARWLHQSIGSVLAQQNCDFELIAVDDGSTDESYSILVDFSRRDPRVCAYTQTNQGVSAARNLALSYASGEYVVFLDSDDALPENSLAMRCEEMEHSGADLLIAPFYDWHGDSYAKRSLIDVAERLTMPEYADKLSKYPNHFYYSALWNKMYRRQIIAENHLLFDTTIRWGEDFLFNVCYAKYAAGVTVLNEPVYLYRRVIGGLTTASGLEAVSRPANAIRVRVLQYQALKELYRENDLDENGQLINFIKPTL